MVLVITHIRTDSLYPLQKFKETLVLHTRLGGDVTVLWVFKIELFW